MTSATTGRFQPTLPHRERLLEASQNSGARWISTHAPAQGATPQGVCHHVHTDPISTHAPAQGATPAGAGLRWRPGNFNPRSRTGSDAVKSGDTEAFTISTHAPAQGATCVVAAGAGRATISTHAPAQGATKLDRQLAVLAKHFNPRSRTGSDPKMVVAGSWRRYFNPRSRTGSDCLATPAEQSKCISTHAPAQGATSSSRPKPWTPKYFNPRSRTGSDSPPQRAVSDVHHFNPRSRTGSDQGITSLQQYNIINFNPRSRTGSDHH